jgi:release factor glutamine methyltransferase
MAPRSDFLVEVGVAAGAALVHDVGTGCGAIALALKSLRPDLAVSGSDISREAVTVARGNATRLDLDVEFRVADGVPLDTHADLALADLPYLDAGEAQPLTAGDGEPPAAVAVPGRDALKIIRHVVQRAPPGLRMAVQHPRRHGESVRALLAGAQTSERRDGPAVTLGRVRNAA